MKLHFIFDKTKKALEFKTFVKKKYKNFSILESDCLIVAGGDGFMLQVLKKYYINYID